MRIRFLFAVLVLALTWNAAWSQSAGVDFFERKIRPILVEHCYECHAATSKSVKGRLLLDSRDGVRKGGASGPALVPGDPEKSLLIKAVRYTDESTKMPKKGKLPAALIADLEEWVRMGAPDPRDKGPAIGSAKAWDEIVRERRKWWSLQPVKKHVPPTSKNAEWSRDPIDRFLVAAMEAKGLAPAKNADPATLIRRLNIVLTGLPPTPQEIADFTKACEGKEGRHAAIQGLVDRLLASPHFGERWARHWMDVVRFTETHGNEWNYEVHHAWRYRDYLIRAFNDDVPYDQFVREHIAGDLLKPRWNEREKFNESPIGTAFYRFGEVNHDDCIGLPSIGFDLVDNQIDTVSKAFQATTIACARCHDHKLDAISTRDYHAMLGILRSSRQVAHTIDAPEVNVGVIDRMREKKAEIRRELADAWLKLLGPAEEGNVLTYLDADERTPMEHPAGLLRSVAVTQSANNVPFSTAWKQTVDRYLAEDAQRTKFNQENFTMVADFRHGGAPWQASGQGVRHNSSKRGEFVVAADGPRAVASILPGGVFTHSFSDRLNGSLRSPILTAGRKYISFQVMGDKAAAVRLVTNNCQLNYRNYRYLTKDKLHWVTFEIPDEAYPLRVYAELMTKFDNPKFPDQLGTLGGDKVNYRIPWEQAAADPRSHFGVTHVVRHEQPLPPRASLSHMRSLFEGSLVSKVMPLADGPLPPKSNAELARRLSDRFDAAIRAWGDDQAEPEDVVWLEALLQSRFPGNRADLTPRLARLIAEYRALDAELTLPRVVPGLADFGSGSDQPIFTRGDCTKPGDRAPRRYLEVLDNLKTFDQPFIGSGRLELAHAIASPDNPLTARVMVNRVWHHLFGAGLVRTVDDFGHVGELPSHPELLDYLATQFVENGWSVKKLIRAIVLTRAFQLSHTPDAAMIEADPENRLLARFPARRMEAEAIRDALLAASGRLDRTLHGPSINAYRDKEYADRRLFKGLLDGNGRRSIYIRVTLMEPPKFLEVFNFPGGKVCQGRRDVASTPAQALAMLNDPFVHDQADVWAKRLIAHKGDTVATRIDAMFATGLNRLPRAEERERFERFIVKIAESHGVKDADVLTSPAVWRDVAHAMFNLQEFISIP
jgi:hypothetical protein